MSGQLWAQNEKDWIFLGDVPVTLDRLHKEGWTIALVSNQATWNANAANKFTSILEALYEANGWTPWCLVAIDKKDKVYRKPGRGLYDLLIKELGTVKEVRMCGDAVGVSDPYSPYQWSDVDSGFAKDTAQRVATELPLDEAQFLDFSARTLFGINPEELGSPSTAALSSLGLFTAGALVPLVPWFITRGTTATIASVVATAVASMLVGGWVSRSSDRPVAAGAVRQLLIVIAASAVTYGIGKAFGTAIASWLAQAHYRRPGPREMVLVPPPRAFRVPLSDKVVGHHFQARGGHAGDLLAWVRAEFPEASLRELLRAYHYLLKTTELDRGGRRRTLPHPEAEITSIAIQGSARGKS